MRRFFVLIPADKWGKPENWRIRLYITNSPIIVELAEWFWEGAEILGQTADILLGNADKWRNNADII
ncbi:hypothetical protein WQ54_22920 [Bacillus sp. SA1-12]|uniref:hypothetical protein n=1 Tax=Bacillus sp. SA1-12 TaxID=1455638 RepID=UPI0006273364|nr:hypothetical protein [Bacillus sp. SA1-12]KKI89991.1 hypothetical protein WQ54_22920 [Bacillus sp. SA1-12]